MIFGSCSIRSSSLVSLMTAIVSWPIRDAYTNLFGMNSLANIF